MVARDEQVRPSRGGLGRFAGILGGQSPRRRKERALQSARRTNSCPSGPAAAAAAGCRSVLPWLVLGLVLYGAAIGLWLGPLPGSTDSFAFKDAAANLALGQGFVTAFNFGNPTSELLLYAGHPPAYPFLAGLWFAAFGVSIDANTWFEELLRGGLALILWFALAPAVAPRWRWPLALVLVLGLPAGMTGLAYDRPDVLALICAIAALLPLQSKLTTGRAAAASLLAGLALTVSPLGGVLAASGIALQWLTSRRGRPPLLAMAGIGALGLFAPLAALCVAMGSVDPSYPARLFGFIRDAGLVAAPEDTHGIGFITLLWRAPHLLLERIYLSFTTLHHWMGLVVLVAVTPVVAWACWRARSIAALAVLAFLLLLCVVLFGWNRGYPAVLALFLVPAFAAALPARDDLWPVVALALAVAIASPLAALDCLYRASMTESLTRMQNWLEAQRLDDVTGDGRVVVAIDPSAQLLFRQAGYTTLAWPQPTATLEQVVTQADAFAFSFNGTGDALLAAYPGWWSDSHATLLYRPTLPQVPQLFGLALARSSKTWEVELWQAAPR